MVVYRPSTGQFIEGTAQGQLTTLATLGGSGDTPITAPLNYRLVGGSATITPTPTPTTPTPTPTTPTPTPTTPTPTPTRTPTPTPSPTSPSSTPLVTVSNVQIVTNKKHQMTEVLVSFSGAVNAAEAQDTALYQLVMAGAHGSFTARSAKAIRLRSASYDAADHTVTLVTSKKVTLSKKQIRLEVDGVPPSGIQDSLGRLIDGDRSGQPGSDATAILTRRGATIAGPALVSSASPRGVTPVLIDALLESNALAVATTPSTEVGPVRRRR